MVTLLDNLTASVLADVVTPVTPLPFLTSLLAAVSDGRKGEITGSLGTDIFVVIGNSLVTIFCVVTPTPVPGNVKIGIVGIIVVTTADNILLVLGFSAGGLVMPPTMACVADWTACSCCLATASSVGGVGGAGFSGCLLLGNFWVADL